MAITNADGIVTPDEDNVLDPEVYLGAMADSISEGIGVRLTAQEAAIGLKASIAGHTRVKQQSGVIAPYEILDNGIGCFTQGMTLLGGVATVSVAGMYFITAAASLDTWGEGGEAAVNENRTIALQLHRSGDQLAACEVKGDEFYWQTAQANTVVMCVPGDTLYVTWYSAWPGGEPDTSLGALTADSEPLTTLSIVLITPVAIPDA